MTKKKNQRFKYKNKGKCQEKTQKPGRPPMISILEDDQFSKDREIKVEDLDFTPYAKKETDQLCKFYKSVTSIPRRPKFTYTMSKEELATAETKSYNLWLRNLRRIERENCLISSPFEHNLEFWRQFWRVIERSNIVIQVVDARNPLLYRNDDLEKYVKEEDKNKINMLLINKADYLTLKQREIWAQYFEEQNIKIIFWSASAANEKLKQERIRLYKELQERIIKQQNADSDDCASETSDEDDETDAEDDDLPLADNATGPDKINADESSCANAMNDEPIDYYSKPMRNSPNLVTIEQLIKLWEQVQVKNVAPCQRIVVGFVGYPNVGKSHTINALYGQKKVAVSAKPGRTKRFQTLIVTDRIMICDCPGLVMPTFKYTKADLSVAGILPIHIMNEFVSPINVIVSQFPRSTFEALYGINLTDDESCGADKPLTSKDLLTAYCTMHGLMFAFGNPNYNAAGKIILRDYMNGRLLYRHPPPCIDPETFGSVADVSEVKQLKYIDRLLRKQKIACNKMLKRNKDQQMSTTKICEKPPPETTCLPLPKDESDDDDKYAKLNCRKKKKRKRN